MSTHHQNPRNALENFLREVGLRAEDHTSIHCESVPGGFRARVQITLPTGECLEAEGPVTTRKRPSELGACERLLNRLAGSHAHYFVEAAALQVEAQRGDALIKLAAYLADPDATAADASRWLQVTESNARLAHLFDQWRADGDPDLVQWGTHLSDHRKGTLVEALIWRRFGARVLHPEATSHLTELRDLLTAPVPR